MFGRPHVEHFERVVARRRHKEPASLHIHCEMVKSPVHAWQRDGLGELERRGFLSMAPDGQRPPAATPKQLSWHPHFVP